MSGRGRGRGRGRGAVPPSVVAANPFGRAPPPSTPGQAGGVNAGPKTEPGPTFPPISLPQPVDAASEEEKLVLRYAERLTSYMKSSPFFLADSAAAGTQPKIDRYSDKYLAHLQQEERKGKIFAIDTDLSFFPQELHSVYDPERAKKLAATLPQAKSSLSFSDALAKLRELERSEAEAKSGEEDDGKDEEDEVVYEDEEFDDETDYNFSYFDNGEDNGDYGDDGDEGPVY